MDFGLIAVVVLTSHVPNVKLDLAFDIVHFDVHQFLIVSGPSACGLVSGEASFHELIYDRSFSDGSAANKDYLGLWNFLN